MVNPLVVQILADRIMNGGINPNTGEPMTLDDIKIEEYRVSVENEILARTEVI